MSAAKYTVLSPCAITSKDGESTTIYRTFGEEVTVPQPEQAEALVAGGFLAPVAEARADEVPETAVQPGDTEPDTVLAEVDVEGDEKPKRGKARNS